MSNIYNKHSVKYPYRENKKALLSRKKELRNSLLFSIDFNKFLEYQLICKKLQEYD